MNQNELYHHGILGQKWGIRRYQNSDGSLTNAGKKRYYDGPVKQKSSESNDSNNYNVTKKSNHRLKLEEKYVQQGMSQKQAEMAAERRIKTEKIVAAAAGITLTAAAAYAANKYVRDRTDQILKSGMTLQRVEMQNTGGKVHDIFYAAKDKADKTKYAGMLGKTRQTQTGHAYVMELAAKKDIKVASKKNAEKVFEELYRNDSDFRNEVKKIITSDSFSRRNKIITTNPYDINYRKAYENFNAELVNLHNDDTSKKFYNALKSKGYGAIQDINDMKFSGYKAKNPLIVFDGKENIMTRSFREMDSDEINKKFNSVLVKQMLGDSAKQTIGIGGIVAAAKTADNTKAINKYRKEHPNTDLTDREIINMYLKKNSKK